MPLLQLAADDARIVALAITYHLGRPGSETDPDTMRHSDLGLASVERALAPQLRLARVDLEVTPYQLQRIDQGLLGIANELKAYDMADRRSAVPGFEAAMQRLFPDLAPREPAATEATENTEERDDDGTSALDLVERVVLLRRRLASALRDAESALAAQREAAAASDAVARRADRPWWRFWQR